MAASQLVNAKTLSVLPAARAAQRLLVLAAARPGFIGALRSAAAVVDAKAPRRTLLPAAVRIERTRSRGRRGSSAEQTALTLWFGEGPSLPAPGAGGRAAKIAAGTALAVVGAAAVGAATYMANQREAQRITTSPEEPRRLEA